MKSKREQILELCEYGQVLTDEMLRQELVQLLLKKQITREQLLDLHRLDQKNGPINVFIVAINKIEQLVKIITALLDRVEQLEAALEFYGDLASYRIFSIAVLVDGSRAAISSPIHEEMGVKARQALTATSPLDKLLKRENV